MGTRHIRKYTYQCQFCGKDVDKFKRNMKKATCFDCKMEKNRLRAKNKLK